MAACRSAVTDFVATCRTIPKSLETSSIISLSHKRKAPLAVLRSGSAFSRRLVGQNIVSVTSGLNVPLQIRSSHTDVTKIPDFDSYRTDATKDPRSHSADSVIQRRIFGYTLMFAGTVMATTAAKYTVKTFIMPLGPTAKTLAESSTEVTLSSIPEGKNLVVKWRNKPLFVRHRTDEEIQRERAVPLTDLRHPETDQQRVLQDKWLIVLGVCTHLGCVPIAHAGDFPGGYYCPCHGSHYDASGRIRKGPAPLNLPVPEYKFIDDSTVVVG